MNISKLFRKLLNVLVVIFACVGFVFVVAKLRAYNVEKNVSTNSSNQPADISSEEIFCPRKEPYEVEPEFERALGIIEQRAVGDVTEKDRDRGYPWINCMHMQYADLDSKYGESVEGVFHFDENSSLDKLEIYVDNSYKEKDDLLLAVLLAHEISHAWDYIEFRKTGVKKDCVEGEVDAFYWQNYLISYFNQEEQMSVLSRINAYKKGFYRGNKRAEQAISNLSVLMDILAQAQSFCSDRYSIGSDNWHDCAREKEKQYIEEMVRNSPFYQEQCNLN